GEAGAVRGFGSAAGDCRIGGVGKEAASRPWGQPLAAVVREVQVGVLPAAIAYVVHRQLRLTFRKRARPTSMRGGGRLWELLGTTSLHSEPGAAGCAYLPSIFGRRPRGALPSDK